MTYAAFIKEFSPIMQVYGEAQYPDMVLELIHFKVRDLNPQQLKELMKLVLETSRFAPRVPDIIENANIVRARHREGIRGDGAGEDGPRTPEIGKQALATITNILSKTKGPA